MSRVYCTGKLEELFELGLIRLCHELVKLKSCQAERSSQPMASREQHKHSSALRCTRQSNCTELSPPTDVSFESSSGPKKCSALLLGWPRWRADAMWHSGEGAVWHTNEGTFSAIAGQTHKLESSMTSASTRTESKFFRASQSTARPFRDMRVAAS